MNYTKKFLLFVFLFTTSLITVSQPSEKIRIIILTDIGNEPDDAQSFIRFLTYANHFDVEGVIATTSVWQQDHIADQKLHEILEAYGEIRDQLITHEPGYPSHIFLKNRIKKGIPIFGMEGVGKGKDSEGSEWIIKTIDKNDTRPVWITLWGGANCLAQALWKVSQTRNREDIDEFVSKIRVYAISDQDDSGPWIRKNFPGLFYICSPGYEENGGGGYHYATWTGISGDNFHGRFTGADFSLVDNPWLDEHIRKNHGPLGAGYPRTKYLMEGDSPSFLYLISNGLGVPEKPDYGSWGGRYEFYIPNTRNWFYFPETSPLWTNCEDEVLSEQTDSYHTSQYATIWRWRQAYQNDFAVRMDWCVRSYEDANHPPFSNAPKILYKNTIPGQTVQLQASDWTDPDGDSLVYRWIYYREAGNSVYWLELKNANSRAMTFTVPERHSAQELHFILAVTDNGTPQLTRYQRIIVKTGSQETKADLPEL